MCFTSHPASKEVTQVAAAAAAAAMEMAEEVAEEVVVAFRNRIKSFSQRKLDDLVRTENLTDWQMACVWDVQISLEKKSSAAKARREARMGTRGRLQRILRGKHRADHTQFDTRGFAVGSHGGAVNTAIDRTYWANGGSSAE